MSNFLVVACFILLAKTLSPEGPMFDKDACRLLVTVAVVADAVRLYRFVTDRRR